MSEKILINYLHRKGYRRADELVNGEKTSSVESMLFDMKNEQDSYIGDYVSSGGPGLGLGVSHQAQYARLKRWILKSLDPYKAELLELLYPIFVHCFLDMVAKGHGPEAIKFGERHKPEFGGLEDEIELLLQVKDMIHFKENPIALAFRTNKYNLRLSPYPFELLIEFLGENNLTQMRKIVNQYINIVVVESGVSLGERSDFVQGIPNLCSAPTGTVELARVHWGSIPADSKLEDEIWKQFKSGLEELKPDQVQAVIQSMKKLRQDSTKDSPPKDRVPLPEVDIELELGMIQESSKRINVGENTLPSACCYTFHNTFDNMNSLNLSPNSRLLASGHADSTISIWSARKEPLLPLKKSVELPLLAHDQIPEIESIVDYECKDTMKRLVAHSGPVYGTSFSYDSRFLLSSSQDGSVRLWSLDTFSNIVAYKGHEGPVWDVCFGPRGHYFVSCSSDRTARLWSTEHIAPLRYFVGHLSDVESVEFHPNSNYVATGSSDRTVRLWDIQQGSSVRVFVGHRSPVVSLQISHDGRTLVSGDTRGQVILWDIAEGKKLHSLSAGTSQVNSQSFSVEDQVLAAGTMDGQVFVWDLCSVGESVPSCISVFKTKHTPVYSLRFTNRNLLFVLGPYLPG